MVPDGPNALKAKSQPQNCCVWHMEMSGAIRSPQAGLQHNHCPSSVDDGQALASYSLLEWSVSAISSLHVITDVHLRSFIKPHTWKCPSLSQLIEGHVIHDCHFWYGQERRKWEQRKWTVSLVTGVIFQRPIVELFKKLNCWKNVRFFFVQYMYALVLVCSVACQMASLCCADSSRHVSWNSLPMLSRKLKTEPSWWYQQCFVS